MQSKPNMNLVRVSGLRAAQATSSGLGASLSRASFRRVSKGFGLLLAGMLAAWAGLASSANAAGQGADPFAGADLAAGERLIREHRCSECHAERVGGDGSAIYRPKGRINSPAALRTMVQRCDSQLSLQMFPEDVEAVSAVLNKQHYHFR